MSTLAPFILPEILKRADRPAMDEPPVKAQYVRFWIDLHYPFLAAVAAYGVAGTKVLALAPGQALADESRLLLCGARAVALLAGAGLEWAVPEREEPMARRPQGWLRVAAATVLALLALWGGVLSAPLLVVLIALIVGALVTVDVDARLKRPKAENAVVAKK